MKYPGRTLPIIAINYKAPKWDPKDRTAVALEVLGQVAFGPNSAISRKLEGMWWGGGGGGKKRTNSGKGNSGDNGNNSNWSYGF